MTGLNYRMIVNMPAVVIRLKQEIRKLYTGVTISQTSFLKHVDGVIKCHTQPTGGATSVSSRLHLIR